MEFQNAIQSMFSGIDQANKEDKALQELQGLFLNNQREMAMQPLDIQRKAYDNQIAQYGAAEATAKRTSPSYIPSVLSGFEGQMASQSAKGKKDSSLLPFQIKAEQGQLENDTETNNLLYQFKQIDNDLRQGGAIDEQGLLHKFSPVQQQAALERRNALMESMKNTPKFNQERDLLDLKNQARIEALNQQQAGALERARLTMDAKIKEAEAKGIKPEKLNLEQLVTQDLINRRERGEITDEQLTLELADLVAGKQKVNRNPGLVVQQNEEGKIGLGQGEAIPTWSPKVKQPTQVPITQQDFNLKWSTLKSGESLVGPDGKTYRKK